MRRIRAFLRLKIECTLLSPQCLSVSFFMEMSSLYSLYCLFRLLSVPEQGGIPLRELKLLHLSANIALYWSPVISGCVIRNSTQSFRIWRKKKGDPEVSSDYDKNLSLPSLLFTLTLFLLAHTHRKTNTCTIV